LYPRLQESAKTNYVRDDERCCGIIQADLQELPALSFSFPCHEISAATPSLLISKLHGMNPSIETNNSSTGQKYSHTFIERESSLPFPEPANDLRRVDIRYV
jgi:hypothetical protein